MCPSASPSSRRAGCTCSPRRPARSGAIPIIVDETLEPLDLDADRQRATSSASASTPATRCAATRSAGCARERGAWVVFGGIHATLFPDEVARARRRPRGRQGRRRRGLGEGRRRLLRRHAAAALRRRPRRRRSVPAGALGSAARQAATCGPRCRPCAAARSTARSARSGAPTARSRGSATSIASSRRSSSCAACGFRFIALADDNFYPVTLDDLAHGARAAPTRRGCTSSRRSAPSASS